MYDKKDVPGTNNRIRVMQGANLLIIVKRKGLCKLLKKKLVKLGNWSNKRNTNSLATQNMHTTYNVIEISRA